MSKQKQWLNELNRIGKHWLTHAAEDDAVRRERILEILNLCVRDYGGEIYEADVRKTFRKWLAEKLREDIAQKYDPTQGNLDAFVSAHAEKREAEYQRELEKKWFEDLNRIGKCWVTNTPENSAAWQAQSIAVSADLYYCARNHGAHFYNCDEREEFRQWLVGQLWDEITRKYDPAKGPLGAFVSARAAQRETDYQRKLAEQQEKNKGNIPYDDNPEIEAEPDTKSEQVAQVLLLTAAELNYCEATSRAAISRRFTEQRMWYTERLRYLLGMMKGDPARYKPYQNHEQDLCNAIEQGYFGFFSEVHIPCRTIAAAGDALLRREKDVYSDSTSEKRLKYNSKGWLPAKVPNSYWIRNGKKAVSDASITQKRAEHNELFRQLWRIESEDD